MKTKDVSITPAQSHMPPTSSRSVRDRAKAAQQEAPAHLAPGLPGSVVLRELGQRHPGLEQGERVLGRQRLAPTDQVGAQSVERTDELVGDAAAQLLLRDARRA